MTRPARRADVCAKSRMTPQEDRSRITSLIVKTKSGNRVLPFTSVSAINGGVRAATAAAEWPAANGTEGLFLLERDLLDQQVIDINGRKVVRVNDVELHVETLERGRDAERRCSARVHSVDVGARGAVRRLLRGSGAASRRCMRCWARFLRGSIPWNFVDVIETDPARRVKLKISHEGLAKLHPADIADIVEDLAPDERQAVFQTLDEGSGSRGPRRSRTQGSEGDRGVARFRARR